MESHGRFLRSQFPLFASIGRCCPPGLSAVQTGQWHRLPAPSPVPFWLQRVSLWRWFPLTVAQPHLRLRCPWVLARRDTRREAARVRRLAPLQTVESQSQAWGIGCHSCTWREGLAPSCRTAVQGESSPRGLPGSRCLLSTNGSHCALRINTPGSPADRYRGKKA